MELVEGPTLLEWMAAAPIPLEEGLAWRVNHFKILIADSNPLVRWPLDLLRIEL
jgi:hypothetical protein